MTNIRKTGYWDGKTAHNHHVHSQELSNWICKFLKGQEETTIIDFGCGLGNYLKDLEKNNFKSLLGIEGDPPIKKIFNKIIQQDLTKDFSLLTHFGNVISLEVGEHIPKEYQDIYIENITKHCNNYLIISWAVRNQPGHGHVNCLDNDEVISIIENKGFKFLKDSSQEARNVIQENTPWFKNTIMIFKKN